MCKESLLQELEHRLEKRVKLRINSNRSTMLSVRWEQDVMRISLHKMFLKAPADVMEDLVAYLKKKKRRTGHLVNRFIETSLQKESTKTLRTPLCTEGEQYDLEKIYNSVNNTYFDGALDLKITWYGRPLHKRRRGMTFGLYIEQERLIKIHRFLDRVEVPEYVVAYIVYHEMLHYVCPPYFDANGRHRIHNKEFKENEAIFKEYSLAKEWIKRNKNKMYY